MYKQGSDLLLAACDEELVGKKFEDGKFHLDVSEKFYNGEKITKEVLRKFLEESTIANLVGKETIKCAIDLGLIDSESVIKVKGIPHAQMVRML